MASSGVTMTTMASLIANCIKDVNSIEESSDIPSVFDHFHAFIINFEHVLLDFEDTGSLYRKGTKQTQGRVFLCFSQLAKCFLMMSSLLKSGVALGKVPMEAKTFISIRMCACLGQVSVASEKSVCGSEEDDEEDDLSGGLFIARMDEALSLLAVFETGLNSGSPSPEQNKALDLWRAVVDDLLGHAMTIAHVASAADLLDIKCSCEKILRELESLRSAYGKPQRNVCECKLYTVSVSSALEKLEQRVCSTVLQMHLAVFSAPSAPLEALVRACWRRPLPAEDLERRSPDDVENLVSAFDAHMDRLLQVALFAVACSTSGSLVGSIRSCLASLEAMEPHLVPALQALYLRKTERQELQHLVRLLSEHWISEVQSLCGFIDRIVDPVALAQVCLEVVTPPAASFKKSLASESAEDVSATVTAVSLPAAALARQLSVATKSSDVKASPSLDVAVQDLRRAVQHLKDSKRLPEDSKDRRKRCLKRCEIVVSCIKRLVPVLEEAFSVEAKQEEPASLEFPDSVRDLPQDISLHLDMPDALSAVQTAKESSEEPEQSLLALNPAGRASLRSTSILYKEKITPKRQSTGSKLLRSVLLENARRTGLKRRSSLFNQTGEDSIAVSGMQESLGLSQLLDGLTSLSDTLRSERSVGTKASAPDHESKLNVSEDEFASCLDVDVDVEMSLDSGGSNSICTPQRLRDLAELRDRIDALRRAHDVST